MKLPDEQNNKPTIFPTIEVKTIVVRDTPEFTAKGEYLKLW